MFNEKTFAMVLTPKELNILRQLRYIKPGSTLYREFFDLENKIHPETKMMYSKYVAKEDHFVSVDELLHSGFLKFKDAGRKVWNKLQEHPVLYKDFKHGVTENLRNMYDRTLIKYHTEGILEPPLFCKNLVRGRDIRGVAVYMNSWGFTSKKSVFLLSLEPDEKNKLIIDAAYKNKYRTVKAIASQLPK